MSSSLKDIVDKIRAEHPTVVEVEVEYSGSGDEGFVNDVIYAFEGEPYDIEDPDLREEIENFTDDILDEKHGGWEINEGGEGRLDIDIKACKATLHHSYRVESTEDCDPEEIS